MKVKDLKLGDIVKCSDKGIPMYVVGLFRDVAYLDFDGNEGDAWEVEEEDLRPIPITPEILERNGFKYHQMNTKKLHLNGEWDVSDKDIEWWDFYIEEKTISLQKKGEGWGMKIEGEEILLLKRISTIHELQHLINDCDIDKEITL